MLRKEIASLVPSLAPSLDPVPDHPKMMETKNGIKPHHYDHTCFTFTIGFFNEEALKKKSPQFFFLKKTSTQYLCENCKLF
jgi:hypothetical protein